MRFLNFLKKHWKVAAMLLAIAIATGVGVAVVNAANDGSVKFDPEESGNIVGGKITFKNDNDTYNNKPIKVKIKATYSGDIGTGTSIVFEAKTDDADVATVTDPDGANYITITPKYAGTTKLTVKFWVNNKDEVAKPNGDGYGTIDVVVPLIVKGQKEGQVLDAGATDNVKCNAAPTATVNWYPNDAVSVTPDSVGSAKATIKALKGGYSSVEVSDSKSGMSCSYPVKVRVQITDKGDPTEGIVIKSGKTASIITNSANANSVKWWFEKDGELAGDNNQIAEINRDTGVVTAGYAGKITLWASCEENNKTAGDSVTISVPFEITSPKAGSSAEQPIILVVGDQIEIKTTARPVDVGFECSDISVMSPSSNGIYTASKTGTAQITVKYGILSPETLYIKVIDGFAISNKKLALNIGRSQDIEVFTSSDNEITWEINNPEIADFKVHDDNNHIVTVTVKAAGTTTLTATQIIDGIKKTVSCEVRGLNPVSSLTLMRDGNPITDVVSVASGTSTYITAYLNFENSVKPDDTKLSWISSDESIITVEPQPYEEGQGQQQLCKITGLKGGKASITVVSEDGLMIATADFFVTEGIESITLDPQTVTAQMALKNYQLTATITPDTPGVDMTVIWSSLDPNVLTVNESGLVTFVAPGTTYVSATAAADPTKIAYCQFTITQQVDGVKMDFDRVTVNVGDQYRLSAKVTPDTATDQTLTWSSSNEDIVTVDEEGVITAVGSGSATIVVKTNDGGFIDMTNVTVLQPVTSIKLSETEMSVKKGTVFWLSATIEPETADNRHVTWSSSDTSLATVDQTGKVTTLGVGTVTISCVSEDNGTVGYCVVEITEPVTGLELNTNYQEMIAGTKFVIIPTVKPIDAPNKNVKYNSSDPAIAEVDENGVVTAHIGGMCEILVTTEESQLTATCTIVVKEFVKTVEISGSKELLPVGESVQLKAAVETSTASDKRVSWSSSNPSYAYVDQTGKVTGIAPGSVVITATAADGGGASDSVIIRVINPVTSITFNHDKISMFVGDTVNIEAVVGPQNASIKDLNWTSDDESIAKVYPDGDVEGIAPGRTSVHATSTDGSNIVATCSVIVRDIVKASSIKINSSDILMLKGKTRKLSARIYPKNTNETVKWLSTDTSIVQVDDNGNIVTVGAGECQVIAYSSAGTVEAACTVRSMAMYCTDLKLEQYDTFNLYVDGAPSAVSWRSSNPRIASVDQNGLVVGRMPGECVVTATVSGKTVTCHVKVMAVDPGKFINRHD